MATGKTRTDRTNEGGGPGKAAQKGASGDSAKVSKALAVLRDGLRTIDDAADLLRAALMDMEEGTRPHAFTGHHLNGVGKFLKLKKEKDQASLMLKKIGGDPCALPGGKRKFA